MKHTKIVLASASPRRVELLQQIGVSFNQQPVDIDEAWREGETPEVFVKRLAEEKAEAVEQKGESLPVLGSDTIVVCDGVILGKPGDYENSIEMLSLLSGKTHQVMTAVSLAYGNKIETLISTSEVTFCEMSETEIRAYAETGESLDKAGAYAVQGIAAQFIKEIKGSYSGIMGLPLYETRQLLKMLDVKVLGSD